MDTQNSTSRYVLIDRLVDNDRPDLRTALAQHRTNCRVELFDYLPAPTSITQAIKHLRPQVMVVDTVWLHLTRLLDRIMDLANCRSATVVVASRIVDEVFKFQIAHRGFAHHLDLSLPADLLVERLCTIVPDANPPSAPLTWNTVPNPATTERGGETARDAIDREILDLVSVGMQDADIANVVHASTQTVKNRISAMLDRSGYRNRTQLAWMHSNDALAEAMVRGLSQRI